MYTKSQESEKNDEIGVEEMDRVIASLLTQEANEEGFISITDPEAMRFEEKVERDLKAVTQIVEKETRRAERREFRNRVVLAMGKLSLATARRSSLSSDSGESSPSGNSSGFFSRKNDVVTAAHQLSLAELETDPARWILH